MRARTISATILAILLLGSMAACTQSSETGTSAGEATTTTEGSGSGSGSGSGGSGDSGVKDHLDNLLGEGCAAAASYYALAGLGGLAALGGISSSDVEQYERTLEELRGDLPSELTDDIEVVTNAYKEFFNAVGSAGVNLFNPSPELERASDNLDSPEVEAANDNITKWLEEHCSVPGR